MSSKANHSSQSGIPSRIGWICVLDRMGGFTRMTRLTRMLRSARLKRLRSMIRKTILHGVIRLVTLARIYRLHILKSTGRTEKRTSVKRMKENKTGRKITMDSLTWRDRPARLRRHTILDRMGI